MSNIIYDQITEYAPTFYTAVRDCKWGDAEHTFIKCYVNFKHVGFEEWSEFCANPTDYMPYSAEIYMRAARGDFGDVAEYIPPLPEPEPDPNAILLPVEQPLFFDAQGRPIFKSELANIMKTIL